MPPPFFFFFFSSPLGVEVGWPAFWCHQMDFEQELPMLINRIAPSMNSHEKMFNITGMVFPEKDKKRTF